MIYIHLNNKVFNNNIKIQSDIQIRQPGKYKFDIINPRGLPMRSTFISKSLIEKFPKGLLTIFII